jgi:hypothetical protein
MVTSSRKQRVWLVLLLVCGGMIACSDSTPIGSIECIGERIRCGLTEKQLDPDALQLTTPTDEISTTGLRWSSQ